MHIAVCMLLCQTELALGMFVYLNTKLAVCMLLSQTGLALGMFAFLLKTEAVVCVCLLC